MSGVGMGKVVERELTTWPASLAQVFTLGEMWKRASRTWLSSKAGAGAGVLKAGVAAKRAERRIAAEKRMLID